MRVMSQAIDGSSRCHSWKFPDKMATDIHVQELLQRYQFGKNDVDNQVSHIVLFEIVIDRYGQRDPSQPMHLSLG